MEKNFLALSSLTLHLYNYNSFDLWWNLVNPSMKSFSYIDRSRPARSSFLLSFNTCMTLLSRIYCRPRPYIITYCRGTCTSSGTGTLMPYIREKTLWWWILSTEVRICYPFTFPLAMALFMNCLSAAETITFMLILLKLCLPLKCEEKYRGPTVRMSCRIRIEVSVYLRQHTMYYAEFLTVLWACFMVGFESLNMNRSWLCPCAKFLWHAHDFFTWIREVSFKSRHIYGEAAIY